MAAEISFTDDALVVKFTAGACAWQIAKVTAGCGGDELQGSLVVTKPWSPPCELSVPSWGAAEEAMLMVRLRVATIISPPGASTSSRPSSPSRTGA